jgi:hypothetical protein
MEPDGRVLRRTMRLVRLLMMAPFRRLGSQDGLELFYSGCCGIKEKERVKECARGSLIIGVKRGRNIWESWKKK